jgi:hypothetical protein
MAPAPRTSVQVLLYPLGCLVNAVALLGAQKGRLVRRLGKSHGQGL